MTEPPAPEIVFVPNGPWADELANQAIAMWRQGLTARNIGDAIGKSRSAVMGKLKRMGLARERQANSAPRTAGATAGLIQQATKRYKQKKRAPWSDVIEIKPEITPTAVGIVELEKHHCRWPVAGEGAAMLYCGGNAVKDLPYCARHCQMAYRGPA